MIVRTHSLRGGRYACSCHRDLPNWTWWKRKIAAEYDNKDVGCESRLIKSVKRCLFWLAVAAWIHILISLPYVPCGCRILIARNLHQEGECDILAPQLMIWRSLTLWLLLRHYFRNAQKSTLHFFLTFYLSVTFRVLHGAFFFKIPKLLLKKISIVNFFFFNVMGFSKGRVSHRNRENF